MLYCWGLDFKSNFLFGKKKTILEGRKCPPAFILEVRWLRPQRRFHCYNFHYFLVMGWGVHPVHPVMTKVYCSREGFVFQLFLVTLLQGRDPLSEFTFFWCVFT